MKRLFFVTIFIFIISCGDIDFVYKEDKNLINPLYEKTEVSTSGLDINFMNSYLPMFFGNKKDGPFSLSIKIEENKIKSSVETNQATSKLRYELKFIYTLILNEKNCVTFKKELLSYFSIIPKSSGYNYGTDTSLEKKYELAITENLNRFTSIITNADIIHKRVDFIFNPQEIKDADVWINDANSFYFYEKGALKDCLTITPLTNHH